MMSRGIIYDELKILLRLGFFKQQVFDGGIGKLQLVQQQGDQHNSESQVLEKIDKVATQSRRDSRQDQAK